MNIVSHNRETDQTGLDRSETEGPSEGSTYRPIGEVAALLRLQPHVLRFWETKFKQIAPLKRSGGRRYYRREDVRLLFQIRDLLYVEGYTLRGAQKALRRSTAKGDKAYDKGDDKEGDKEDKQRHHEAQKTPHLSPAARADLLRLTKKLEEVLARCSEERSYEKGLSEEGLQNPHEVARAGKQEAENTEEHEETASREQ